MIEQAYDGTLEPSILSVPNDYGDWPSLVNAGQRVTVVISHSFFHSPSTFFVPFLTLFSHLQSPELTLPLHNTKPCHQIFLHLCWSVAAPGAEVN